MTYKAAAVILNYNGKNFLEQFLPNVCSNTSENTEVIVIDNASTDDSRSFLQSNFPDVKTVYLEENNGYAGGYNLGLKNLDHPYFILLNSDIEVTKNWDIPLINRLESNAKIAAVQPKILAHAQREYFEYAGGSGGYLDHFYFPFCRGRIFGELEKDLGQYNDAKEVFWASGACFAVNAAHFKNAKGFDADFFAHMEEIDLCHRFKNFGYQIWVEPSSTVYHVGGGTLAMMSPFKTFLNYRNGLSLLVKNYPHSNYKTLLFKRLILDGLSAVNFVLRGIPVHAKEIWKAHRAFFKQWNQVLEKRKEIQEKTVVTQYKGYYNGSVIWNYFAKGKRKFTSLPPQFFEE